MTLYRYVGPLDICRTAMNTARFHVRIAADVTRFAQTQILGHGELLWATFIVDKNGALWIADRRSEHIGCSRGEPVQAAGELAFELQANGIEIIEATNQSTGFCPPVESWVALEGALDQAGIVHSQSWTSAFEFRCCPTCGATNLVKDQ